MFGDSNVYLFRKTKKTKPDLFWYMIIAETYFLTIFHQEIEVDDNQSDIFAVDNDSVMFFE